MPFVPTNRRPLHEVDIPIRRMSRFHRLQREWLISTLDANEIRVLERIAQHSWGRNEESVSCPRDRFLEPLYEVTEDGESAMAIGPINMSKNTLKAKIKSLAERGVLMMDEADVHGAAKILRYTLNPRVIEDVAYALYEELPRIFDDEA